MTLSIHGDFVNGHGSVEVTPRAAMRARTTFNPSGNEQVDRIKTLAAALYTELEAVHAAAQRGEYEDANLVGREAATAMTQIQSGAMFAVSAVTAPKAGPVGSNVGNVGSAA